LLFLSLSSALLSDSERSLLDLLLLDLGGGDRDRDSERVDVLAMEGERLDDLLRFKSTPASGDGDLE